MARQAARRTREAEPSTPGLLRSRLRLFGVAIICAKVALVPLVFDVGSDIPFAVAKGLLSHALAYALLGVIVGLIIAYGRTVFVWSWLHVPVLVFLAANVLATLFAADY